MFVCKFLEPMSLRSGLSNPGLQKGTRWTLPPDHTHPLIVLIFLVNIDCVDLVDDKLPI